VVLRITKARLVLLPTIELLLTETKPDHLGHNKVKEASARTKSLNIRIKDKIDLPDLKGMVKKENPPATLTRELLIDALELEEEKKASVEALARVTGVP